MQDVSGLVDRLLGFLELSKDFVTAETLIQLKDLLRRYPHIAEIAIASIAAISPQVGRRLPVQQWNEVPNRPGAGLEVPNAHYAS